ncbi:MAG: hypothetical protein HC836_36250 [Richelia sp. RM2_1_2]|nr:hypothetical protein [Richelia sp. SM2_1_7]NJM20654.1 hypothetical protein [Richelia sp. SM1_7_0]NJN12811.1 hypothetical protein [Richelia sp. RM1_1_1]NJO27289.1 hypothetical protein [Richelia sp. SL_2_1]NJO63456.1 hypothetical protein [Richelia sp. RM2_1_2]
MSRNKIELSAIIISAVVGITGFCFSHSRQPYPLAQIQFCPQTANKKENILTDKNKAKKLKHYDLEKAQKKLDSKYCHQPRYVLAEEWDKYNSYGSIIPYMGSTISLVRIIPKDNPYQIYGNVASVLGLWGISLTLASRVGRLKKTDYQLGEEEKTIEYYNWQQHRRKRDIKQHSNQLYTDTLKDGLTQEDLQQRKELGLTDDENEAIKNQLQLEDYLKARAVKHSEMDKQIASNLLDKHKAEKEIDKLQNKKSSHTNTSQSSDKQLVNSLIEALKSHEDSWLYSIVKNAKPLWLIGSQGSGKTNTAGAIALIRKYCFDAPIYQLIDRHATGENWEVWKLLDATLKAESEEEIGQSLEDATDRWLQRIKEKPSTKQQIIIDEFTNLKKIDSCKEAAMKFFSMHLTDTRKAKEYFIGVNHYFTNESTVEGTFEARKSGTIQLKKFSANGETPLSRVQIVHGLVDENGNELEEVERTLPSWLEANKIYGHFNGIEVGFE